jgi:hypothetical protein
MLFCNLLTPEAPLRMPRTRLHASIGIRDVMHSGTTIHYRNRYSSMYPSILQYNTSMRIKTIFQTDAEILNVFLLN